MSTYATKSTYMPTGQSAALWPLVVTIVMFFISFVPGLGLINLLLATPMSFVLIVNFLSKKNKTSRVALGFLFLGASIVIPLIVGFSTLIGA